MSVQIMPRLSGRVSSALSDELRQLTAELASHPLNSSISSVEDLRVYLVHHVWCVWDFMCLASSVERGLREPRLLWAPPASHDAVYAIRELLQGEETDIGPDGKRSSHFEIYLRAMQEAGADTTAITEFLRRIGGGDAADTAMDAVAAPAGAKTFVLTTLSLAQRALHERVGALCLGREDLLPAIFDRLLTSMPDLGSRAQTFLWYIRRHVELDTDVHGPLTEEMFLEVTRKDPRMVEEAMAAGREAILARRTYMDQILRSIRGSRSEVA